MQHSQPRPSTDRRLGPQARGTSAAHAASSVSVAITAQHAQPSPSCSSALQRYRTESGLGATSLRSCVATATPARGSGDTTASGPALAPPRSGLTLAATQARPQPIASVAMLRRSARPAAHTLFRQPPSSSPSHSASW